MSLSCSLVGIGHILLSTRYVAKYCSGSSVPQQFNILKYDDAQQILYDIVQYIASLYSPDKLDHVQKAAKSFRLPYWDWAATPPNGTSVFPLSMGGEPNIAVSGPNGVQTIANPLFSYTFKPFNGSIFPEPPVSLFSQRCEQGVTD